MSKFMVISVASLSVETDDDNLVMNCPDIIAAIIGSCYGIIHHITLYSVRSPYVDRQKHSEGKLGVLYVCKKFTVL